MQRKQQVLNFSPSVFLHQCFSVMLSLTFFFSLFLWCPLSFPIYLNFLCASMWLCLTPQLCACLSVQQISGYGPSAYLCQLRLLKPSQPGVHTGDNMHTGYTPHTNIQQHKVDVSSSTATPSFCLILSSGVVPSFVRFWLPV